MEIYMKHKTLKGHIVAIQQASAYLKDKYILTTDNFIRCAISSNIKTSD